MSCRCVGGGGLAVGEYHTGDEPMQIISGACYGPKIHLEAPPWYARAGYNSRIFRAIAERALSQAIGEPAQERRGTRYWLSL